MYRIWSSYLLSKATKTPAISGLPISIAIEPTTACNLRCPECPSGLRSFTRPTGKLDEAFYQRLIDEVHESLLYLTFYFQGEPYLHPDFLRMVQYAGQRNIYTATSTNAHFLTDEQAQKTVESGLDRLIISIDGSTQETYEAYRKSGDLQKVLDGTERIVYWRKKLKSKTPAVLWQFLVVKPNEHQIPDIKRMAKEMGVDKVAFKTAQIYDYAHGNALIPTIDQYSRYRANGDGTYAIKAKQIGHCWKMWHSCVITWDGKVVPCCFDKDAQHNLGDLKGRPFKEIWHHEKYVHFRRQVLQSRKNIDICANCSEGTTVWGAA